jgi:hypothetical protein
MNGIHKDEQGYEAVDQLVFVLSCLIMISSGFTRSQIAWDERMNAMWEGSLIQVVTCCAALYGGRLLGQKATCEKR